MATTETTTRAMPFVRVPNLVRTVSRHIAQHVIAFVALLLRGARYDADTDRKVNELRALVRRAATVSLSWIISPSTGRLLVGSVATRAP